MFSFFFFFFFLKGAKTILKLWDIFVGLHGGVRPVHKVEFDCRHLPLLYIKGDLHRGFSWTKITLTLVFKSLFRYTIVARKLLREMFKS